MKDLFVEVLYSSCYKDWYVYHINTKEKLIFGFISKEAALRWVKDHNYNIAHPNNNQIESENLVRYKKTSQYKVIEDLYSMDSYGIWSIKGEETDYCTQCNCRPELEVVEGRLENVICYAVDLKGFWTAGLGGDIDKVEITKRV